MTTEAGIHLSDFCSGHIVVNENREVDFCNSYISKLSDKPISELVNASISNCFTKASNIFIDSYVYPMLLIEFTIQEVQLSWVDNNQQIVPVIVNIRLDKTGKSYWSIYECTNRDKLQTELIKAKELLEKQSQELYQLATTDPLTGLINRRELQTQTKKIIEQAARTRSTFALLYIDVDFFKQVNDTHGHQVGDTVLKHVANLLKEGRRVNDLVARIGGEEFVILLLDIDKDNAYQIAENVRKKVAGQAINNIQITISIGVVISHNNEKVNFDTLLNWSDEALYASKNSGRNKTTVAEY